MFKYKTLAEIDKMTAEEKEQYSIEKRKYEEQNIKNVSKEEAEKLIQNADLVSKSDYEALKENLSSISEEFEALKEKTTTNGIRKGELSLFFEKNINKFDNNIDNIPKDYSVKHTIKAAALMTTSNVLPVSGGQFNQLFTNYIDTEIGHTPKPDNFILKLVNVKPQPSTEKIYWVERINEEGDAEFVAEGALSPLVDGEYQQFSEDVFEVTNFWKFTMRLMLHAPSVESDFKEHAQELVEQKIDTKVLLGNNTTTSTEPDGITTLAGAFIAPTQLANIYVDANIFDAINACATRIRLNNFNGQITCVLNTVWEAKFKAIKDRQNRYIMPSFVTPDGRKVGSVNIEFQNKIPDTHMLIGDLKKFNVVMSEDIEYTEGFENDDFRKRQVSRQLNAMFGTYIKSTDAGAIIYNSIADVLTQIVAP